MMKIIIELATQPSEYQAEVIIALIGFFSAGVVSVFGLLGSAITLYLNKRNERKIELRKIKESQYLEFLGNLASFKISDPENNWEIRNTLSARAQTLYLVGSDGVQRALKEFFKYVMYEKMDITKQNKLYADLICEMRKDLYGESSMSLDRVELTTFKN